MVSCADKEAALRHFPELKESEDEEVRKSKILLLQRGGYIDGKKTKRLPGFKSKVKKGANGILKKDALF